MSVAASPAPAAPAPSTPQGVGAYARRWWTDVRSGELGSLPIIVGLVVVAIVFQTQNDRFLTAGNFVNLIVQTAPYTLIAMGVVFVLLLGEIDLSIGFVSGVAGVLTALWLTPDGNELPTVVVIALALLAGAAIGTLHGVIITKVGVPSFVVTLAGLLAWNGVVLLLIGSRGTVILQDEFVIALANDFMPEGLSWLLMLACVALYAAVQLAGVRSRRQAGLEHDPLAIVGLRVAGLAAALAVVTYVANLDRGIPYVLLVVAALLVGWGYLLKRTRFGRHVYAVGGNAEAARRGGHRRRPGPHRGVRPVLAHGGGGRDHPRLPAALRGHEHGRRDRAALPHRLGGDRGLVAVRRTRAHQERAPGRPRDHLHRQRARPPGAGLGREARHHGRRPAARRGPRLRVAPRSRTVREGVRRAGPASGRPARLAPPARSSPEPWAPARSSPWRIAPSRAPAPARGSHG